jgi:hypothetical protein
VKAQPLNQTAQDELLELLSQGASPPAACRKLGLSLADFFHTTQRDPQFRRRVEMTHHALGQNVASALYRAAMKGNVAAQTFWLRFSPPPGWTGKDANMTTDDLDRMTDDELLELARAHGVDLPPEIEAEARTTGGEEAPRRLPAEPAADE